MSTMVRPVASGWDSYAAGTGVDHFAWWAEANCLQSVDRHAGLPLVLEPWQLEFFGEALATDGDDLPYWSTVVLVVARKNGKSTMLGAYGAYHLDTFTASPEVLLAASSDKQAGRLFDAVTAFVRRSPRLLTRFHIRDHIGEIARSDGIGKMHRMSSDPNRAHGYNPSRLIADELHAWGTPGLRKFWEAMTTAGGAREDTQAFVITTAGEAVHRASGILGQLVDRNEKAGELEALPGLTISRNHEARVLVYNYSAPVDSGASESEQRKDLPAVRLANPASWVTDDYLARQAASPELDDSAFLQLHACVWASGSGSWIADSVWDGLADAGARVPDGASVCLGADGDRTHASAAVGWASLAADGRIDVGCHVFAANPLVPHHTLHRGQVDYEDFEAFVVGLFGRFEVVEAAFDNQYLQGSGRVFSDRLSEERIAYVNPRSNQMRNAVACFQRALTDGRLRHRGDPVLRSHALAAVADRDSETGEITRVRKAGQVPIRALVAVALAVWRVENAPVMAAAWAEAW